MREVSKNMARSIASQRLPGRAPIEPSISASQRRPSMIATGEGGVEAPPGVEMHDRSAARYGQVMRRFGG
jgi:hypothetical protein